MALRALGTGLILLLDAHGALAATATRAPFGTLPDGRAVEAVTLDGGKGVRATVISYGATLQSLETPARDGRAADIVLGYATLADYLAHPQYFGATIGRYANRIAGARFTLDGRSYAIARNDHANTLHGGTAGFDKQLWRIVAVKGGPAASVTLALTSPDGDQGYPGTLRATATYTLEADGDLRLDYTATTDRPTVVNITNHSFFNLAGEASGRTVEEERLTIPADRYTPVDGGLIPTGEMRAVAGTPFDFRTSTRIGDRIRDGRDAQIMIGHGYDHNYVVTPARTADLHLMVRVDDPGTGRAMEILSDQPGLQVYTGNFLDGSVSGKGGHGYRMGDGMALEPQIFPDTPNQPAFGSARLDPGQTYHTTILYRFSTTPR